MPAFRNTIAAILPSFLAGIINVKRAIMSQQFHKLFPYVSTCISISIITLILLTEITMLKHMMPKVLENHYAGAKRDSSHHH